MSARAPVVAALYRYPVKGLSPEPASSLTITADSRVEGDRVLALQFANAGAPNVNGWWPKQRFVTLMNTPGLASLEASYNPDERLLDVRLDGRSLAEASLDEQAGRAALEAALTRYVLELPQNPLARFPARVPLRLAGDGVASRFHDSSSGRVTLLNRASVLAVSEAIGAEVDERRFRANVILEGLAPGEELAWAGRQLEVGGAQLSVVKAVVRCLATNAAPDGREWDLPVLQSLTGVFGTPVPTMGVAAVLRSRSPASISLGDRVELGAARRPSSLATRGAAAGR